MTRPSTHEGPRGSSKTDVIAALPLAHLFYCLFISLFFVCFICLNVVYLY